MIFRSPSAPQDIRIAKITAMPGFTGDAGVQKEQIVVMGTASGAIITYEVSDGRPDAEAENAIRSVCSP